MASSVEALSPTPSSQHNLESHMPMAAFASPVFSPSSDKRFWSTLRGRVDTLLENRNTEFTDQLIPSDNHGANRLKEDTMLLLRGFDSVASSLSQLTNNLDNALQGTRDLAKAPTLTDIFHSMSNMKRGEDDDGKTEGSERAELEDEVPVADEKKGLKRKLGDADQDQGDDKASSTSSGSEGEEELNKKKMMEKKNPVDEKLKKAKNLAVSMATKTGSLARELKSIKADLCFAQERCALLEEENRRLRNGFGKGIRVEEDDLVRMQLEALLAEKSRLANENTNLTRENHCLRQLVEYHQFAN